MSQRQLNPMRRSACLPGREPAIAVGTGATGKSCRRPRKSRVVLVRDTRCLDHDHNVVPDLLSGMVNRAVVALSGEASVPRAFAHFLEPGETALIKAVHDVHDAVLEPILRGLLTMGAAADKLILYQRRTRRNAKPANDLERLACRYGVRLERPTYSHPPETVGSARVHLADVLYDCDCIINVPSLVYPDSVGGGAGLASHRDSVRESAKFRPGWTAGIVGLNALPAIREKTRLILCDAVQPAFASQTPDDPRTWDFCAVIAASDPVALDTVGNAVIGRHRTTLGLDGTMTQSRSVLASAARIGLGNHRGKLIDLLQIGL